MKTPAVRMRFCFSQPSPPDGVYIRLRHMSKKAFHSLLSPPRHVAQAGLTNKALGNNCVVGFCCYVCFFPLCLPVLACVQRAQVRQRHDIQGCLLPGKARLCTS